MMKVFGTKGMAQPAEDMAAAERLRAIASRFKTERPTCETDDARPAPDDRHDEPQ
jgi:hypothetical protein